MFKIKGNVTGIKAMAFIGIAKAFLSSGKLKAFNLPLNELLDQNLAIGGDTNVLFKAIGASIKESKEKDFNLSLELSDNDLRELSNDDSFSINELPEGNIEVEILYNPRKNQLTIRLAVVIDAEESPSIEIAFSFATKNWANTTNALKAQFMKGRMSEIIKAIAYKFALKNLFPDVPVAFTDRLEYSMKQKFLQKEIAEKTKEEIWILVEEELKKIFTSVDKVKAFSITAGISIRENLTFYVNLHKGSISKK